MVCFDLETSDIDTSTCQILEIACVVMDPIRLEVIEGSEFVTLVRPEDESTLKPDAMAANKIPLDELRQAPPVAVAWRRFVDHVKRFSMRSGTFAAPFPMGKNIKGFDLPIIARYCRRFGPKSTSDEPTLFNAKWVFDLEDDMVRWFGLTNMLDDLSMDTLREFLGMDKTGAHRALTDVRQTAWMMGRFFKLYREQGKKVIFKNAAEGIKF